MALKEPKYYNQLLESYSEFVETKTSFVTMYVDETIYKLIKADKVHIGNRLLTGIKIPYQTKGPTYLDRSMFISLYTCEEITTKFKWKVVGSSGDLGMGLRNYKDVSKLCKRRIIKGFLEYIHETYGNKLKFEVL